MIMTVETAVKIHIVFARNFSPDTKVTMKYCKHLKSILYS